MKIYTKTGDDGTTGLFYGGRVDKHAAGPEAYGTVDEAVAALGVARASAEGAMADELLRIQRELFVVAAELATAPENRAKLEDGVSRVTGSMVTDLEGAIDRVVDEAGMPTEFVVPGGNDVAAAIDVARTVVRRAERRSVSYAAAGGLEASQVVPYLNRLADYLYMLARAAEGEWVPSRVEDEK
jgi:cob(I)alamin adenosyltransferase